MNPALPVTNIFILKQPFAPPCRDFKDGLELQARPLPRCNPAGGCNYCLISMPTSLHFSLRKLLICFTTPDEMTLKFASTAVADQMALLARIGASMEPHPISALMALPP